MLFSGLQATLPDTLADSLLHHRLVCSASRLAVRTTVCAMVCIEKVIRLLERTCRKIEKKRKFAAERLFYLTLLYYLKLHQ